MSYTVDFDAETGIVYIRVFGQLDRAAAPAVVGELMQLMRARSCRAVINDLRDTDVRFGAVDLFEISRLVDRHRLADGVPRAVIVGGEHELAGFYETVNANLGHRVRVFTDPDEARTWLASTATPAARSAG
jgi:hypothetical protein